MLWTELPVWIIIMLYMPISLFFPAHLHLISYFSDQNSLLAPVIWKDAWNQRQNRDPILKKSEKVTNICCARCDSLLLFLFQNTDFGPLCWYLIDQLHNFIIHGLYGSVSFSARNTSQTWKWICSALFLIFASGTLEWLCKRKEGSLAG